MSGEWGDDMADMDRPDDSAEHWSARIKALEAENRRLADENLRLKAKANLCEGCGANDLEHCCRHPDKSCWREFHGSQRLALRPTPSSPEPREKL